MKSRRRLLISLLAMSAGCDSLNRPSRREAGKVPPEFLRLVGLQTLTVPMPSATFEKILANAGVPFVRRGEGGEPLPIAKPRVNIPLDQIAAAYTCSGQTNVTLGVDYFVAYVSRDNEVFHIENQPARW